jgi:hypothetical protein
MARMDELYNDIYTYCEENECWKALNTITEWNKILDNNYGVPSYTALVNAGKLEKEQRYGEKVLSYRIVPTGRIKELMEAQKVAKERENAEWVIVHYDEQMAMWKARYEEMIKQAEEKYQRDIEWEAEKLAKAKAILGIEE